MFGFAVDFVKKADFMVVISLNKSQLVMFILAAIKTVSMTDDGFVLIKLKYSIKVIGAIL